MDKNTLSEDDLKTIFEDQIKPNVIEGVSRSQEPRVTVLGGQIGSGKSTLRASEDLLTPNKVSLSLDDLKELHPAYPTELTYQQLSPDALVWRKMCVEESVKQKYDMLLEMTLARPALTENYLETCKNNGYKTEIRILATPNVISALSAIERYERQLEIYGFGHQIALDDHDETADLILKGVKQIEENKSCDKLTIQTREGDMLYNNQLVEGKRKSAPTAFEVFQKEQERPLTLAEVERFTESAGFLAQRLVERKAPSSEKKQLLQVIQRCREAIQIPHLISRTTQPAGLLRSDTVHSLRP